MQAFYVVFIIFGLFVVFSQQEKIRYDGFQVYRITPKTENNLSFLRLLEKESGLDFWTSPRAANLPVDIMVPPQNVQNFTKLMYRKNLDSKIMISNVQHLIDNERGERKVPESMGWNDYRTLEEINIWLSQLAIQYPDQVILQRGGSSYENRTIDGVKVSFAPGNENRSVYIEGGIHACEWISSAVVTYILNQLLTSTDPNVREVAESHDWYIFPVVNPDGFAYTHLTDRLWRKTRVPHGSECYGADPNRNWDYHYKDGGSSDDPCSFSYAGPEAFSEPSTKSLSEYLSTIGPTLEAFFGFHSYSQILLLPYGYTEDHLDNYDELYEVGLIGLEALAQRYGTQYDIGNVAEIMYVASGGSPDWVKGTFGTRITYTYELRDTGEFGFLLPADQIVPTGQEILDSVVTILQEFARRMKSID